MMANDPMFHEWMRRLRSLVTRGDWLNAWKEGNSAYTACTDEDCTFVERSPMFFITDSPG